MHGLVDFMERELLIEEEDIVEDSDDMLEDIIEDSAELLLSCANAGAADRQRLRPAIREAVFFIGKKGKENDAPSVAEWGKNVVISFYTCPSRSLCVQCGESLLPRAVRSAEQSARGNRPFEVCCQ